MEEKNLIPEYDFKECTQDKILSVLVREKNFLVEYRNIIKASYFRKEIRELANLVLTLWDEKRQLVTRGLLLDYAKSIGVNLNADLVHRIYEQDISDSEVAKELAVSFARKEAVRAAIFQAADLIQTEGYRSFDRIESIITNSFRQGRPQATGVDFAATDLVDILNPVYTGEKRSTGYVTLDHFLGGLNAGDISPVLASSGKGKSIFLVNVGYNNMVKGNDVYHISLGDLREDDVMMRYLAIISGMTMQEISSCPNHPKLIKAKKDFFSDGAKGKLMIQYYPSCTITPADIKNICTLYRDRIGRSPGMIILDYADELKSSRKRENSYEEAGEIYSELKQVGFEMACPVFTASQINRANYSKSSQGDDIGMEAMAESMKKVFKADSVLSISQSLEDMKKDSEGWQRVKLFIAKNRRGEDGISIKFAVNKSRMLYKEIDSIEDVKARFAYAQ